MPPTAHVKFAQPQRATTRVKLRLVMQPSECWQLAKQPCDRFKFMDRWLLTLLRTALQCWIDGIDLSDERGVISLEPCDERPSPARIFGWHTRATPDNRTIWHLSGSKLGQMLVQRQPRFHRIGNHCIRQRWRPCIQRSSQYSAFDLATIRKTAPSQALQSQRERFGFFLSSEIFLDHLFSRFRQQPDRP